MCFHRERRQCSAQEAARCAIPKYPSEHVEVGRYRNGYTLFQDGKCFDEEEYSYRTRAEADAGKVLLDREPQIFHEAGERVEAVVAQLRAEGYPEEAIRAALDSAL